MSKRSKTEPVEDLYCDEGNCEVVAFGPCSFCGKDLCYPHGDVGVRYQGRREDGEALAQLAVFICVNDRDTPISTLFTPTDRVQRRFDEFNMAKAAAIGAPIAEAKS